MVGLGATGLPLAVALAQAGLIVLGVDPDPARVAAVGGGRHHHVDPMLSVSLEAAAVGGRLSTATDPGAAQVFVVTSPIGFDPKGPLSADFGALSHDLEQLAPLLIGDELIILETSGPLGMTLAAAALLRQFRSDLSLEESGGIDLAYVGERPRPGHSYEEVGGARAVGGLSRKASKRAAEFYRSRLSAEVHETDHRTAEMVKLVENAYRDLNIAFANELSMVCDDLDISVLDVIAIANHHPRVDILRPGPGVGGHSIALDPKLLAAACPDRVKLVAMARSVNEAKPAWSIQTIVEAVAASGASKIACLGLTSKPGTDQFDESPAIEIARALTGQFPGRVVCADPYQDLIGADVELELCDVASAMATADLVVFLVSHEQFRSFRPGSGQTIIDLCGATELSSVQTLIIPS